MTELPPPPPFESRRPRLRKRQARRGQRCLNCETDTTSPYCPECGQENVEINISLFEIFREAAEEFFRIDSKLSRTLTPLLTKPGLLTKEWRTGRRARYISPLKLYLTVTFIFFLLLPILSRSTVVKSSGPLPSGPTREQTVEVEKSITKLPSLLQYPLRQLNKMNAMASGTIEERERNASAFKQHFVDQVPTALFIMLPVFAGVLWLLYLRGRRYYVEHLVFALHCHSFYFVLLTITVLIAAPGLNVWVVSLMRLFALWVMIAYSVIALKVNYDQDWLKTLLKAGMLGFAYMILFSFTLLGCVVMAASALPELPKATPTAKPASGGENTAPSARP